MRLKNKVAIVTGAGSGFGEAIARRFAEEGAQVVVNDIAAAGARRVATEIGAGGGKAAAQVGDVS
ncbi:MAG: SDR family NAD(P)-dependent oxidoreductase, partial [Usitatibacter sp.]